MSKRKKDNMEGAVDGYFHGQSIEEPAKKADRLLVTYAHHVDEAEKCWEALSGDDVYSNAMRAYLLGRDLDVPTTCDDVYVCRVALEYNHWLQSNGSRESRVKSTEEQYEVYKAAVKILVDEHNRALTRKTDYVQVPGKKACLALFGTNVNGRSSSKHSNENLTFRDVRHHFDAAISHRDKRMMLESESKKMNNKARVSKLLTFEDCNAWTKLSSESPSSKSSGRTENYVRKSKSARVVNVGDGVPIGMGSTHIKVTTVVEETSPKEEMSREEIQEALAELPARLQEITGGRPLDVAFGFTKGWDPKDEDEPSMTVGDIPLTGKDVTSRVVDFEGCAISTQFEKEILEGMDEVRFLKPSNKDRRMRIATEVPDGVLFTLGSGNGTSHVSLFLVNKSSLRTCTLTATALPGKEINANTHSYTPTSSSSSSNRNTPTRRTQSAARFFERRLCSHSFPMLLSTFKIKSQL